MRRLFVLLCLLGLAGGCAKTAPVLTPPAPPTAAARPVAASTDPLVYNPRIVQFDSPDHATVSSYKVEVWLKAADPVTGQPMSTLSLAKDKVVPSNLTPPAPQLQANLADTTPLFAAPVGQTYVLRLVAVGLEPTLVSPRSDPSGPFEIAGVPRSVVNLSVK